LNVSLGKYKTEVMSTYNSLDKTGLIYQFKRGIINDYIGKIDNII